MNKNILIELKGIHNDLQSDDGEPIITKAEGEYYYKERFHYLIYKVVEDGVVTSNRIKFNDDYLLFRKKSDVLATMEFLAGEVTEAIYQMPGGKVKIDINTRALNVNVGEANISISIKYEMMQGGKMVSISELAISVSQKS